MPMLSGLRFRMRALFRPRLMDKELEDELRFHFEKEVEKYRAAGLTDEEARRQARLAFGGETQVAEDCRDARGLGLMTSILQDVHYALRQMKKSPGYTVTAVLTLALGIGANTAIFTVVESVLLSPLPYQDASRIVALETKRTNTGHSIPRVTGPDGADVRAQAPDLEAVSLYTGGRMGVQLRDHAVFTGVEGVDADFPLVFSLRPIVGRWFTDSEANHAALVSERFARDNFGSPGAAVGKTIGVESMPMQIIGVLPASFDFPARTQVWAAIPMHPESESRTAFNYKAVARLKPGVSLESARAELTAISRRLTSAYPVDNRDKMLSILPLQEALTGEARPTLLLLWGAVALILLIACVNVAHLELTRSIERQRELAVRTALGASGWRLSRAVMVESLLISLAGGIAGVLLAVFGLRTLLAITPAELTQSGQIHLNGLVLAFTAGLTLVTALAAALAPARKAAKADPVEALKRDSSRGMSGRSASTLRDSLVIAEIAATFILATGAGLLVHSMAALRARSLGYDTARLLVVDSDAPAGTKDEALRTIRQYDTIFAQLAALPGVKQVAGIMGLPTGSHGSNGNYGVEGGPSMTARDAPWATFSVASPNYFRTMAIPILRGRDFNADDSYNSNFVAVISESLARQSFGDANPIGRHIQCGLDSDRWMTVVGVVGDVRQHSPAASPGPTLYMPMTQHPFFATEIHIVLRTSTPPLSLMHAVRATIDKTNPQIATSFTTMDAMVGRSIAVERFRSLLVSGFAAAGLLLAMLGVYGTMAYAVAQRKFEIGLRMAFGAERSRVLKTVLGRAGLLACWGIALGLAGSLMAARLIAGMLAGVRPIDPISLGAATAMMVMTALVAALLPARRAAAVNPIVAIRND